MRSGKETAYEAPVCSAFYAELQVFPPWTYARLKGDGDISHQIQRKTIPVFIERFLMRSLTTSKVDSFGLHVYVVEFCSVNLI